MQIEPAFTRFYSDLIYAIVSSEGAYSNKVFQRDKLVDWKSRKAPYTAGKANNDTEKDVTPSGTKTFAVEDSPVAIGDTGLTVTVTDLMIDPNAPPTVVDGKKYNLPSFSEMASATIDGTGNIDTIDVTQDEGGDTVVEVRSNGEYGKINLGRIASLTINSGGNDDSVSVSVKDYFGGVNINSGSGNDTVAAHVTNAFRQGVIISGGSGNDNILLSGKALSTAIDAGAGNDVVDASPLSTDDAFVRGFSGGAGSDRIYGTQGIDTLIGAGGSDYISALGGNDLLTGDDGRDILHAGAGNDRILAGAGDDRISGGAGDDALIGDEGDDILMGNGGNDTLLGRAGNDYMYTGDGHDSLHGGTGSDNFGPMNRKLSEIYAYGRTADYLQVDTRGEFRAQPRITDLSQYVNDGKYVLDLDSTEDYLVDDDYVI